MISSLLKKTVGVALVVTVLVYAEGTSFVLPEKMIDLKEGEIARQELLAVPQLIIMANRKAFEVIEEAGEIAEYPRNTVWVPNISAAPKWVIRAFIRPSLVKTAKKVPYRMMDDSGGEWARGLQISSEEDDYLSVFYADQLGVKKVLEKMIPKKDYKKLEQKQSLVAEIIAAWKAIK